MANAVVRGGEALRRLVAPEEWVSLLGVVPTLPPGWQLQAFRPLAQMVCDAPLAPTQGPEIVPLGDAHREDVLALTALVYPHYFRPRTMDLGRYFGIYREGRLAAMIGERLGDDSHREMSAICTHPDFHGLGYAGHLTTWRTNDPLAHGHHRFLHGRYENRRALGLYARRG